MAEDRFLEVPDGNVFLSLLEHGEHDQDFGSDIDGLSERSQAILSYFDLIGNEGFELFLAELIAHPLELL